MTAETAGQGKFTRKIRGPGVTPRQAKAARALIGADQATIAEAMGIARPSYAQFELGNTRLAGETALSFIRACADNGVALIGANIPKDLQPDLNSVGEGVIALNIQSKDDWVVNGIIMPNETTAAAHDAARKATQAASSGEPFSISFNGTAISGELNLTTKKDLDVLISLLQSQRVLLKA